MNKRQSGPYLVTGASGQLGRLVLEHLIEAQAAPIIATTRSPDKLSEYAERGVDVRVADFNEPATLASAFAGAKRVLIISTDDLAPGKRQEAHHAAINAAIKAKVEYVVYTSLTNPGPDSPISFAADHSGTEAELIASGISHAIMRNNLYTDLFLMTGPQAVAMGKHFAAAADGKVGYVTRQDCAHAAASALLTSSETATFDITGPALVGQQEVAEMLSSATGKEIAYVPISVTELEAAIAQQGMPDSVAKVLASIDQAIAAGTLSVISSDVEKLTGVKPTSVSEFFTAHADVLRGNAP